ncbi:endolysin [Arthrobacter phage Wyborn]|uniref:Endolysin n=1 Tax=Arthrobacter phage Wyborn TaxID=3059067 RepID=A0AA96GZT4_9CAUD|nr:endolysin [Arthrobacter phage Wyborn]
MTNAIQEAWLRSAPGRSINPDNAYGLQCVDVADDYANVIFGVNYGSTIGHVVGARDFYGRSNAYVKWVPNVVGDASSIPQRGDIIVWNGNGGSNPYGHVAVVLEADANSVLVVQQDGFMQTPCFVGRLKYDQPGTGPCLGWLRPLVKADAGLQANQRLVGAAGVNERMAASKSAKIGRVFKSGDVLTFKGYVKSGSDTWFVGAFSGTFFHSSGFTNQAVGSLKNLTPSPIAPPLLATQRRVGKDGAALRKLPNKNAELVGTFKAGDVLNFVGYVIAERPYGAGSSDVWFKGISGAYVWAGAVENGAAGSLPNLTPKPSAPAPAPAPAPVVPGYSFAKRWQTTTGIKPASIVNMQRGNMPARPEYLVIHQIDDPSRAPKNGDWLSSAVNYFSTPRPDAPTSAHMVAQAPHMIECVDSVDRAFHAGAVGNNYLAVEVPPNPDAATIELVKKWQREWRDTQGYLLKLTRHMTVPGNSTSCGTNIDLALFDISHETDDVPTKTEPDSTVVPDRAAEASVLASFFAWLTKLFINRKDAQL